MWWAKTDTVTGHNWQTAVRCNSFLSSVSSQVAVQSSKTDTWKHKYWSVLWQDWMNKLLSEVISNRTKHTQCSALGTQETPGPPRLSSGISYVELEALKNSSLYIPNKCILANSSIKSFCNHDTTQQWTTEGTHTSYRVDVKAFFAK